MPQHWVSPSQHSDTVSNLKSVHERIEGRSGGQSAVFGNHHAAVVVQPRAAIPGLEALRASPSRNYEETRMEETIMNIGSGLLISRRASLAGYFAGALALGAVATAGTFAAHATETLQLKTVVSVPNGGKITSFDISFVDPVSGVYVLADRTNKGIDVIDTATNTFLGIAGQGAFTGSVLVNGVANNDVSGPDGVMVVHGREIWAGDGDSTLKILDLFTGVVLGTIPTGQPSDNRVDEMCFDPVHNI